MGAGKASVLSIRSISFTPLLISPDFSSIRTGQTYLGLSWEPHDVDLTF
jgi:hypothetical protein